MAAIADDRDDYHRRSAVRYVETFRLADLNGDQVVSQEESTGNVAFEATFDDIDINRDGNITWFELTRYIDSGM
jgi:hypothetical protein